MQQFRPFVVSCVSLIVVACGHGAAPARSSPITSSRAATSGASSTIAPTAIASASVAPSTPSRAAGPSAAAHVAPAPAAEPEPVVDPEPEPEVSCGEVRVRFDAGSASLDSAARTRLAAYAECVAASTTRQTLYIAGAADGRGASAANAHLASARARAVADFLHAIGCHQDFEVRGFTSGSADPQYSARTSVRSAIVSTQSPFARQQRFGPLVH